MEPDFHAVLGNIRKVLDNITEEGRRLQYNGYNKEDFMKALVLYGAMAAVLGFGLSAFAAESNAPEFFAISGLSAGSQPQAMTDGQLTKVEGMSYKRHNDCGGCRGGKSSWSSTDIHQKNDATQLNLLFGGKRLHDVGQGNYAYQSNNVGGFPSVR